MTSTIILPFTNKNNFSNPAMAQEMGYYDDEEYVDYNSDVNYNSDDETYSDYQDEENKYECRTGPFEGFFVSSVEFCKVKLAEKDDKKDIRKDNGSNQNPPPPQNNGSIIYAVWSDNSTADGNFDIFFASSNNNGQTFRYSNKYK